MRAKPSRSRGQRNGRLDPRAELVQLHRAIHRAQAREIDASVHGYTGGFRAYQRAYESRVRRYRKVIDYSEVVARATRADIVYVGDYHTLKHAQKAFAELARFVLGHGRPIAFALEFVRGRHQKHVDAFLRGRLGAKTFLKRIEYEDHHLFPVWENFSPLFEMAREMGIAVLAIDKPRATLSARDTYAATRIARFRKKHPDTQIFVLTGQLHVAPSHLPRAVDRALRRLKAAPARSLVVYQNCEEIYWRLTSEALEHTVSAVEVADDEVCLVNTSPIIAQQSYLNHLHAEDPLDETLESAPEQTFKNMCRALCSFLEVSIDDALDRVTVYSLGDLSFLAGLKADGSFTSREIEFMERQILASESYYIPRSQLVYLANLSVNHASEEAAHYLRHVLTDDDGDRDGLVDAFYARILNEGLAFFGSKVINPRRKAHHRADLTELVDAWDEGDRRGLREIDVKAARVTLAHLRLERGERVPGLRAIYGEPDADLFNAVTHLLGYILGDKLYYGMIRGKTTKEEMRELFLDPLHEDGDAFHAYFYLSSRVASVRAPRRP